MQQANNNLWVLLLLGLGIAGNLLVSRKLRKMIRDDFGAFINTLELLPPPQSAPPGAPHPLTSLTFAVSDLFDIEGYVTGFGHPDWARTHNAATQTSPVVSSLADGGATCIGKTVVDELAYSINGENEHYGTPTNPEAPARVPGGSSSGAAVAVAANLVDFSLGVDDVGGVRVPASFCGVLGFRTSYGVVPHLGISPVSASLDTVGWFAKDPGVLCRVGHVLLQLPTGAQPSPRRVIMADDCFHYSDKFRLLRIRIPYDRITQVVIRSTEEVFGGQVLKHENLEEYLYSKVPSLKDLHSNKMDGETKTSTMRLLADAMKLLHSYEFRGTHGEWIQTEKLILDPAISTQINDVLEVSDDEIEICRTIREEMRSAINTLLEDDGILVIPTTAYHPPKLDGEEMLSDAYQTGLFSLLSIASLSGCCQVTIPLGQHYDMLPASVSLIARHGGDQFLLETMQSMHKSLQEQFIVLGNEITAEICIMMGSSAEKQKDWKRAVSCYTDAIKLNGKNPTYYRARAAAYLKWSRSLQGAAEHDCTIAISLDYKNAESYLLRGTVREKIGDLPAAMKDFRFALKLEPTNEKAVATAKRLDDFFNQRSEMEI